MSTERNPNSQESPAEQVVKLKAELEEAEKELALTGKKAGANLVMKVLLLKSKIEELEKQAPLK
ncbi:MAG: hypothetical protein WC794_03820 [Candidatus Doudnabacteria bacterium]|jgi:hypothetical protein